MSEADLDRLFLQKQAPYIPPFYSINLKDKEKILSWLRETDDKLKDFYAPLFREQKENWSFVFGSRVSSGALPSPYLAAYQMIANAGEEPQEITSNQVYRLIRAQVSLVCSNELVPDVLPSTDEYSDKVACNVCKSWLESMHYDINLDQWRFIWEMYRKIFGECFMVVQWDPNKGDIVDHDVEEEEFDLLDEEEKAVKDRDGKKVKLKKKQVRIGDIRIATPKPFEVMIDPQDSYDKSSWFYFKERIDLDYLKKKYPKLDFEADDNEFEYDGVSGLDKDSPNRRCVYYFYHKSHEFLPEGRYLVCTRDHILINEDMGLTSLIETQELPLVRMYDMDLNLGVRGLPTTMRNLKSMNAAYNSTTNQIFNNLEMESPKIFVHESAGVDARRMPTGITVCEWRGNIKPTIETPTTNTSSIFKFRDDLKRDLDELAGQMPMQRGDVPNSQMDSFVALQHFEDQRVQLAGPEIKSHIKALEHLFRLEISTAKDKYHPDDQRLIKILGKHNSVQLRYFNPINLDKSYDVKIYSTGNLANSKAARTQMIMNIKREFPALIADEFFLDTLGLSHSQKFMNALTAAVSSAEAENQDMYEDQLPASPTRYEDLIAHWETHRIPMQTLDFKRSPLSIQEKFILHVTATEKLMFDQAKESPTFADKLQTLRQFPMFYTPTPTNLPPMPMPGEPGLPPEDALIPPEGDFPPGQSGPIPPELPVG